MQIVTNGFAFACSVDFNYACYNSLYAYIKSNSVNYSVTHSRISDGQRVVHLLRKLRGQHGCSSSHHFDTDSLRRV